MTFFTRPMLRGAHFHNPVMSDDMLRKVAPSIFAAEAHDSRSARYTYIPTVDILNGLRREGFQPVAAMQSRARDESKREHTKHLIRLRHESTVARAVGDEFGEIVLINSHDGTSSYQMTAGMFRLACLNGLVVGSRLVEDIRVPHKGNIQHDVIEGAFRVLDQLPKVAGSVDAMKSTQLVEPLQLAYARAAIAMRYDTSEGEPAPVKPEQLLRPRRQADTGSDVWTVFNRVQENMIRGGLRVQNQNASGRRMSTREVHGIDQSQSINRGLWTLAEELRKLAA